jgi:3-ketoacyl-CoA synthase
VIFPIVDEALKRCHLRPVDIDILVLNCSLFNPTPSMTAMVREIRVDIKVYD